MPISYPPMSFAGSHRYCARNLFLCCNMNVLCQSSSSRSKAVAPWIISKSDRLQGGHIHFRHSASLHHNMSGRWRHAPQTAPQVATNVQLESFSPSLAMQQSVWDSIANGSFINAKIYVYSRRSRQEPGRVHTPKVLFVNTHVLAAACDYFRSSMPFIFFEDTPFTIPTVFELSGIETTLGAEPPSGVDATFDLEDHDSDSDYDLFEEAPYEAATQTFPDKIVKAYVAKCTAYRTYVGGLRSLICSLMKS